MKKFNITCDNKQEFLDWLISIGYEKQNNNQDYRYIIIDGGSLTFYFSNENKMNTKSFYFDKCDEQFKVMTAYNTNNDFYKLYVHTKKHKIIKWLLSTEKICTYSQNYWREATFEETLEYCTQQTLF